VAKYVSGRMAVVYAGRVVEIGPTEDIMANPKHPYTQALLNSIPSIETKDLKPPVGEVPSLVNLPKGCRYNPRCPYVMERCKVDDPQLKEIEDRQVACWLY